MLILYSRPRDATPIVRPSRNVVPFMPIDTLNTSRSQHSKPIKPLKLSESSFYEHDPSRKRKRETIREQMKPRPAVDASQSQSNGSLVSRATSPDKGKTKTMDIDRENDYGAGLKNDSDSSGSINVSGNRLSHSPPVTQNGSLPKSNLPKSNFKKPQHPMSKTVPLEIRQLTFGSYTSFDDELVFAITIMPKRRESVSEIFRNGEVMKGFNFSTVKIEKLTYCLATADVVLTLKSRHTIGEVAATADTLIFQAKDQMTLMSFLGDIEDTVPKIVDMEESGMAQLLANLRYQPKRRSLPTDDSGHVSSHFPQAPTPKTTYSSSKDKKSRELLTPDQFDAFWPESWNLRTRSASSSTPKSSILDNLDEHHDVSDVTHSDRASRSRGPKVYLGDPLKYSFGNKTIVITEDDFSRLDEGEFLNDTIIDFYLRYIQDRLQEAHPEIARSTYIFNTFFYKRLTQRINGVKGAFDNVKKWTSKVDLFSMKYVIIPIHERAHWYLAVIVNLCELGKEKNGGDRLGQSPGEQKQNDEGVCDIIEHVDSDDDDDRDSTSPKGLLDKFLPKKGTKGILPNEPVIFIFDSLKLRHNTVFRPLRDYLVAEAQDKRGITIERDQIKSKYGYAPAQPNYCDCGVYVAHYVEAFLSKPEALLPLLVDTQNKKKLVEQQLDRLWEIEKLSSKREHMQNVILELKKEMQASGHDKIEPLPMSDTGIEEFDGPPQVYESIEAETSEVIDDASDSEQEDPLAAGSRDSSNEVSEDRDVSI
ncbi:hypothetical protein V1509DRAFT_618611 [Lipomyces kononenkoae]